MKLKKRRLLAVIVALVGVAVWVICNPASYERIYTSAENSEEDYSAIAVSEKDVDAPLAREVLEKLEVKGYGKDLEKITDVQVKIHLRSDAPSEINLFYIEFLFLKKIFFF